MLVFIAFIPFLLENYPISPILQPFTPKKLASLSISFYCDIWHSFIFTSVFVNHKTIFIKAIGNM